MFSLFCILQAKAAAARRGEALKAFDTNAISPGTQFMNEVTSNLKFYVRRKISENGAWQVPKVIISGKFGRTSQSNLRNNNFALLQVCVCSRL